jgi:hypothetical protein
MSFYQDMLFERGHRPQAIDRLKMAVLQFIHT